MHWKETLKSSLDGIINASEQEQLFASLSAPSPTSLRLNPRKPGATLKLKEEIPWCPDGFYLESRPAFQNEVDFHLGRYYVQEAASMFLSHVLKEIDIEPKLILDMCAAPGGKSSLLIDAYPESLIVANEIDAKRNSILEENLTKWGATNVLLAQAGSKAMGQLGPTFDLILVDAPCSGEGMLRKSEAARKQYNQGLIEHCVGMQKRILDQVLSALRPGGLLVYSTCTWNRLENEHHFLDRSELKPLHVTFPDSWQIAAPIEDDIYMHRFFPHKTASEGLCLGVFQKTDDLEKIKRTKKTNAHFKVFQDLNFSLDEHTVLQNSLGYLSALPSQFLLDLTRLSQKVQCRPLLTLGTLDRKLRLIPDIALAQQMACPLPYHRENLSSDLITAYLRRESLPGFGRTSEWIIASHQDLPLGFLKDVGKRCNNAYPPPRAIR